MSRRQRKTTAGPQRPTNVASQTQWFGRAVLAVCALYSLVVVRDLWGLWRIVTFPIDVNFGEGLILCDARRMAAGLPIYRDFTHPPYWFSNYPPLYTWVSSLASSSFVWPRLVTFLASLFCAGSLALVVWRIARAWTAAFLAGALWIVLPYVGTWSAVARVDVFGRALECAAVVLVWMWPARAAAFIGALVFATAAMATKQTMVAGGITCFLVLWFRSPRRALVFGASWFVTTCAVYGALIASSDGWFFRNVFRAMQRDVHLRFLGQWTWGYVAACWPVLIASGLVLKHAWRDSAARVLVLAAIAGIPSVLLAASDGADRNYYFDLNWALCGLAGFALARIPVMPRWGSAVLLAAHAVMVVLLLALGGQQYPNKAQRRMAVGILQQIKSAPGPLLAEMPGLAVLTGHDPEYLPYMLKKVEERGGFDSTALAARIRRKEFGTITLTGIAGSRWSQPILDAINASYSVSLHEPKAYMIDGEFGLFVLTPDQP